MNLKKLRLDMYEAPSENGPADGVIRVGDDEGDAVNEDVNHVGVNIFIVNVSCLCVCR